MSGSTEARVRRASPTPTRRRRFFWIVVAVGIVMLALYAFGVAGALRRKDQTLVQGWRWRNEGNSFVVISVDADGPAAGLLEVGDRLLAVDNTAFPGGYLQILFRPVGDPYDLRVRRRADVRQFRLATAIAPEPSRFVRHILPHVVTGFAFCLVGIAVGLLRPQTRIAHLLFAAFVAVSADQIGYAFATSLELFPLLNQGERVVAVLSNFSPFSFVLIYHFFSEFPSGRAAGRGWTRLRNMLYVAAAIVWVPSQLVGLVFAFGLRWAVDRANQLRLMTIGDTFVLLSGASLEIVALVATAAIVITNYRRVRDPDQARRLRWVVLGCVLALAPGVISIILEVASQKTWEAGLGLRRVVNTFALWCPILIPLTFAHAVLKHQLLDVHVVMRRGVQYLLARNALRVAVSLPLVLLMAGALANPNRTLADIATREPGALVLAGAAALALRFRLPLTHWLDRRFFREAYDAEQTLLALMDDVRTSDSLTETARLVSERVQSALHSERILIFYRDLHAEHFSLGHSSTGAYRGLQLGEDSTLLRALERDGRAREVLAANRDLSEDDQRWLAETGARLVVPIGGRDRKLVGLLVLGEKKSEQPYTRTDRRLLEGVVAQIGIVYENAVLRERAEAGEREKHEVLDQLAHRNIVPVKECPACRTCYEGREETCPRDGARLRLSLPVERTIDGKYRLERLIGQGGMGAVYEATDLRLNRVVAVKVVLGRLFGEHEALRRFEREARTVASLQHRHVVAVYDYGQLGPDGAYFVMEILHGATLREELQARGALAPMESAVIFDQVLDALQAAHAKGIVHRDLKPENVFLARESDGEKLVKILDFGLAKVRLPGDAPQTSLTVPGMMLGTLRYASPEQLAGGTVDQRADLFALGLMVLEVITGFYPFAAKDATQVVASILYQPFGLEGDAPEIRTLEAVLQRCLAKDVDQRLGSAAEVRRLLIPALRRCPNLRATSLRSREDDAADTQSRKRPLTSSS